MCVSIMAVSKYIEDDLNNNEVKILFPYEITRVDDEINKQLLEDFTGERSYFVQVGPKKYFFPSNYEREAEKFYNFKVRQDDIWIVTFPRSGTTWTQEAVWLIANDLDFDTAKTVNLNERCPFLEFSSFVHSEVKNEFLEENKHSSTKLNLIEEVTKKEWRSLALVETKRIIKTHLPFSLLPPDLIKAGCKVIYVARNPKDVIASFYYLNKLFRTQGYDGDLPKYWKYFKRNLQPWTPYWEHLKEGWERRFEKNVCFMFYEDINKNSGDALRKIASFLGKKLSNADIEALCEHMQIENFKSNPAVNSDLLKELGIIRDIENGFIRSGKTGGWKDDISGKVNEDIDRWIEENLKNTDMRFPEN